MTPILRSHAVPWVLTLLPVLAACGGDGPTDPDMFGNVEVTVTADGAARAGVAVRLFVGSATSPAATATTSSAGVVAFNDRDPGAHAVEIDVPTGFVLSAGQTARRNVNVTAGQTADVAFALQTAGGGGGDLVEILATDALTFSNPDITISPGTTVRWRSTSSMTHTVTPDGHAEWNEGSLGSSGATFTHTFNTAGTFDYYCEPHRSSGMTGRVIVQ